MRVHLIDGTYELFRAHFSKRPPRVDRDGRDVKATAGVVSSLLGLLHDEDEAPTHVAVAFDNPIESFRNRMFAGYKDGSGVEPALRAQFDAVEEAVAALGVTVWSLDEHEADDALATAAVALAREEAVTQVRIMTPDKDLGQVVSGDRVVQVDRRREVVLDEAGIVAKQGVPPTSIPDLLALVGDTADGIPGLAGFGAKSAAAVLARYGHLEDVPDDAVDWDVPVRGAARLAGTLAAHREEASLYRDLATLRTDVVLDLDLERLAFSGVPRERYLAWCDALDLDTLRDRPQRWS
ncbi:flap endonuclease [Nitriliruptoraceae bacterium ZYF776]|nr:flap endonuclease [Profundirhabdus halotolerans]